MYQARENILFFCIVWVNRVRSTKWGDSFLVNKLRIPTYQPRHIHYSILQFIHITTNDPTYHAQFIRFVFTVLYAMRAMLVSAVLVPAF